ncbi:hypothetical protein EHW66_17655 [Erwinia psidii]|uniref:Uncharacterized protein n=1 Tax=Erwinia psidii TaxID=69224 RepID=A0A3N6RW14_9GAMM|nr:hypothetical protein [Erwinia psidii]RQM37194.1 hypothetical protein EB241_16050 [Erwinia psidii]
MVIVGGLLWCSENAPHDGRLISQKQLTLAGKIYSFSTPALLYDGKTLVVPRVERNGSLPEDSAMAGFF